MNLSLVNSVLLLSWLRVGLSRSGSAPAGWQGRLVQVASRQVAPVRLRCQKDLAALASSSYRCTQGEQDGVLHENSMTPFQQVHPPQVLPGYPRVVSIMPFDREDVDIGTDGPLE